MEAIKKAGNSVIETIKDLTLNPVEIEGKIVTKKGSVYHVSQIPEEIMISGIIPESSKPEECYHCGQEYLKFEGKATCPECGGMTTKQMGTGNRFMMGLVHDCYDSKTFDDKKAQSRIIAYTSALKDASLLFS